MHTLRSCLCVLSIALLSLSHRAAAQTTVAVGPQYDSTHVYVAPADVDRFAASFLATFGGTSTKQVVTNVLPVPSSTTSQLLQTPVGPVSLFGFRTPIPAPFGQERTGYLVKDMDRAITAARAAGADVLVTPFHDPIGIDAVIQWPGGVNTQLYWHTTAPTYAPLAHVPENRVYLSQDRADAFLASFLTFSQGTVVSDDRKAAGDLVGKARETIRVTHVESAFGKLTMFVTDGHLPYPYGRETSGYEVANLDDTLQRAKASGATVLVEAFTIGGRRSAMVQFPGGFIAEIHALSSH